ncbi:10263_t:CDS:2, partial [Racocetra persica]
QFFLCQQSKVLNIMNTNDSVIHEYFERKATDWNIRGFLDECKEKPFKLKIEAYCLSLENIIKQGKLNHRHGKAQLLLDRYKKSTRRATKPVWGTEQTTKVGGPSIHFHQPTFSANTINGINNTGAFDIHLLKESKKRKKDQEDEEEDEGIDNPAILYDRLIVGIETARENQTACLMTPLCWGVVDLRAENVSPCPKHPRAKEFLSDTEVQNLQQTAIEIINKESHLSLSAKTLLETLQCSTFSLRKLSKEKRARGIEERTVDMHLIGPFSKMPVEKVIQMPTETRSLSSRNQEQLERRGNGHEIGIGENTSPTRKDHHKKSFTDFVDVINVARSQHISFQTKCIEKSGRNPLPSNIENVLKSVPISFFQVIGMKIRFYILIQINGDLYGMWEWSSQDLPRKDDDIITAMALCKKFLIHR